MAEITPQDEQALAELRASLLRRPRPNLRPDRGDEWRLWNLADRIPEERRFTRVFRGRRELIDHILVSRALVTPLPSVDTGDARLPSITENPTVRRDEPASDHAPVVARFDLD